MKEGFYEKIVTETITKALNSEPDKVLHLESFSKNDGAILIQRYFQEILQKAFNQITEERDEIAKQKLIDFTNDLVKLTATYLNDKEFEEDQISNRGEVLKAFFHASSFTQSNLKKYINESFPITGLSESALFNGSKHTPSLESELKKEMLTSDEVWWLVSFLKFEGVRLFEQVLRKMENEGKKVKIICTVYMGATDLKAIDFLSEFSNVDIKISFNTNQERLHAKSYLFMRNSGFHTAYIGSSNLSRSALTNGLEWNLKVTQQEIPHIISKCKSTFDTYWNDANFEFYVPEVHRDKLQQALEKGKFKKKDDEISKFFDITPFPFQQQILDQLFQCRDRGEMKNLVVAATGTGKTVISAFDFKGFLKSNPTANFLFVAHREEILRQARYTFRQVLKNPDFGELWFNGENPDGYNQLFVSIQTLNNRINSLLLSPDFFDYIIIDEVHHSAASSYQQLLSYFNPKILLGLTATPERHDGANITKYFGNTLSAEIRLPDALNQKLLCPFQYFGITDDTDISRVSWRRGRYEISELEKIYTEDRRRALEVIRNCQKYLTDYQDVRALGFCVSKKHAEFMSNQYNLKGLKASYLHADNSNDRKNLIQQFRRKEINYLFVVDIFNEGVDIPEIDTLLFLRPTESLTIFLQQLGRGLRLHDEKICLTVLDFVGQQHAEYSFEHKFRAMLGKTHTKVKDELQQDFPNLPLGCSITLEETAKDIILKNIQSSYGSGERSLLRAIERFLQDYNLEFTLKNFCELMGIELYKVYKSKHLLFELKYKLEGKSFLRNSNTDRLVRVMGSTWLATDSESYFKFLINLISRKHLDLTLKSTEQFLVMCYLDVFDSAPNVNSLEELNTKLSELFDPIEIREELLAYLNYRLEQIEGIEKEIELKMESSLKLHGRYTRNQILSGLSESNLFHQATSREGVYRIKNKTKETELLFVTLYKDNGKFNASTMYHDYFINEELFHWQSQNSTAPESLVGQSYIKQTQTMKDLLLFVRESTSDENGVTMAFVFCGKLHYVQHEGRKPMSITWKLETPPPAMLLNEGRKLLIG
jgi:superfamily II DNA or RNA helicase/HKD family nuclease